MPCPGGSSSQVPGTAQHPPGYRETLIFFFGGGGGEKPTTPHFQFPTPKLSKFPSWERRWIKTQQFCNDARELKELNLSFLLERKGWTRCPNAAGGLSPSATRWSLQHGCSLSPRREEGDTAVHPSISQLGSSPQPCCLGATSLT